MLETTFSTPGPALIPASLTLHTAWSRVGLHTLERSDLPRSTAMAMVGHKTESIYRRYAIVDEQMHREAAKLDLWTSDQQTKPRRHGKEGATVHDASGRDVEKPAMRTKKFVIRYRVSGDVMGTRESIVKCSGRIMYFRTREAAPRVRFAASIVYAVRRYR